MNIEKILNFHTASRVFDALRAGGKKIVQCHGTFDLVHPGHIYHLEEAKALGDILVVTVTGEKFVNKGPGRPFFNDSLRAKSLAAISCVDYVVIVPHEAAVEAIDCVKPDIYCKGSEYLDQAVDVTGNIQNDLITVQKHGGKVQYVGSVVFSSTKLLNNHLDHLPSATKDFCKQLSVSWSPNTFREAVDNLSDVKVLLIGDIIFDKYSYVKVQGLTSKASIVSARHLYEEIQPGGVLAVYRHLKEFTKHVKLVSLLGTEEWAETELGQVVDHCDDLIIRNENFTSVVKHRFVGPIQEGKELQKYFSVNFIDNAPPNSEVLDSLQKLLESQVKNFDIVMVMDFGHGVMQKQIREYLQDKAGFLAVNCQTNSNNHGFNIINKQYRRMDCFSLDETELLLAVGQRHVDYLVELTKLRSSFSADYAWLTRGSVETIGLKDGCPPAICFPLEPEITDTVGAGDAFFSLACLGAAKGYDGGLTTFLGQLAGAQAVKIVGNTKPICKKTLLKSGMALLNF